MPATLSKPRFVKEILKPGIYYKNKKRVIVTEADVAERRDSIRSLHAAGLRVPVIYEHPEIIDGQVEGIPATSEELDNHDVMKYTVGKTVLDDPRTLKINADGGLDVVLEISDPTAAQQLASDAIEFVSPELRPSWQNPLTQQVFPRMVSHIALTHNPIQIDQRPGFAQLSQSPLTLLRETVQLSAADLISRPKGRGMTTTKPKRNPGRLNAQMLATLIQLAGGFGNDDDENDETPPRRDGQVNPNGERGAGGGGMPDVPNAPPSNPDMPAGESVDDMQLEALLAHLKQRGFALPADTDASNLVSRLLVSAMTLNEADVMNKAEKAAGDREQNGNGGGQSQAQEFSPMNASQMSNNGQPISDATARNGLVERITKCKQIPQALRDNMLVKVGTVQFSNGVEKVPAGSISIGELLAMYESQATQFSAGSPQATLAERITKLRGVAIPPGIADNLLAKIGTVQFSADGQEVAAGGVSLSSLVAQYEVAGRSAGALLTDQSAGYQQLSNNLLSPSHPAGDVYVLGKGPEIVAGSPQAIKVANDLLSQTGHGTPINADGSPQAMGTRRIAINATEAGRA